MLNKFVNICLSFNHKPEEYYNFDVVDPDDLIFRILEHKEFKNANSYCEKFDCKEFFFPRINIFGLFNLDVFPDTDVVNDSIRDAFYVNRLMNNKIENCLKQQGAFSNDIATYWSRDFFTEFFQEDIDIKWFKVV